MVGQPVSIFNARVKTVCLCWHRTGKKRDAFLSGDKRIRSHDRVCNNKQGKTGMKTENTLRTVRNSLLCFFMALGAGFLVACGGSGSGSPNPATSTPQPFTAYLSDSTVQGVEYSSLEGDGVTGTGGVFLANEGVFVFSIGGTTLGSVQMSRNQEGNEVTPADFIGVDEAQVITIARIMQALDLGNDPTDGISISQDVRQDQGGVSTLYSMAATNTNAISAIRVGDAPNTYDIPSVDDATNHLAATRRCLFSGGYEGDFEGTRLSDGAERRGQSYYAVEPFANRARTFTGSTVNNNNDFVSFSGISTVGVIGSTITLSEGNELSFITPRLVAGVWRSMNDDGSVNSSGTENLTLAADTGNPGATRRIVGVETTDTTVVAGMYVLDYFKEATVFRGRHYDVDATLGVSSVPLSLTIVNGVSWPTAMDATTLTLIGDNATITVGVVRMDGNYGIFDGVGNELSGTWCDIGGAVGSTIAPTPSPRTPPAPSASAQSSTVIVVTWSAAPRATLYNLYRSTASAGPYTQVGGDFSTLTLSYRDDDDGNGLDPNDDYFYQLEACNSSGCSGRSPEVSAAPPAQLGQCREGLELDPGQSCTWIEGHTISVSPGSGLSVISIAGPVQFATSSYTRLEGETRNIQFQLIPLGSGTLRASNNGDNEIWTIGTLN